MQIRTEFTIGSKSLHGKVQSAHLIGLAPVVLAIAIRIYQPYLHPLFVGAVIGLTIGHQLILWGAYNLIFREDLGTRMAARMQATARIWFPVLLTATRYAFFVLCFSILWACFKVIGIRFSMFSSTTFFLTMLVLPVHKLVAEFIPEGRSRREFRLRRTLMSLRTWCMVLFILAYVTDRFEVEMEGGLTPLPVILVWLLGVLILAGTFILWIDDMLHPDRRKGRGAG
ncbi:MAG: hypothetical protein U1F87_18105 [Kiritimatiellia bacterium]